MFYVQKQNKQANRKKSPNDRCKKKKKDRRQGHRGCVSEVKTRRISHPDWPLLKNKQSARCWMSRLNQHHWLLRGGKQRERPGRSCRNFTDTRQKYGLQAPVHTLTQRSLHEECTQTHTDAQHRPPCCETSFTQILGLWKITFFLMSGLSCVSLRRLSFVFLWKKKDLFYRNRQFIAGSYKYGTHVF